MNSISTNGWDTVYAVRFTEVNNSIKESGKTPSSFEESDKDDGTSVSGSFESWELATGGDGKNVNLNLTATKVKVNLGDKTFSYNSVNVPIQINLEWVVEDSVASLKPTKEANVTILEGVTFNGGVGGPIIQGVFTNSIKKWLQKNPQEFEHIFSTVNINYEEDKGSFKWLKPNGNLSYAVTDGPNGDINNSVFAVLSMTSNNTSPSIHAVSPNAIKNGFNSGLLISSEIVVKNLLMPNIDLLFDWTRDNKLNQSQRLEYFVTTNDGNSITNNKEVYFPPQTINEKTVNPVVGPKDFELSIEDNFFVLNVEMKFEWPLIGMDLITVKVNHTSHMEMSVDDKGQFSFVVKSNKTDSSAEESTGLLVAEIAMEIAGAVIGAGIGAVIGGAVGGGEDAAIQGGADALTQGTQMTTQVTTSTVRAGGMLATNVPAQAAEDSATGVAELLANAAKLAATPFKWVFAQMSAKLIGGILGMFAGALVGAIPAILGAVAKGDGEDFPTIEEFGAKALTNVKWPGDNEYVAKSLDLNQSLRININKKN